MTDSSTGSDLGPRPAEDGVPAFDETYEWISESPGQEPIKVQAGIIYIRDPRRAAELSHLQTQAIVDVLTWVRQYRLEVEAGTRCPSRKTSLAHCVRCQNAESGHGERCTRNSTDCLCAPFHLPDF
jgi:hypothetical protein